MAKRKKVFNFKPKVISAARRIFLHSPIRREAMERNKTSDGFHRCEQCRKLTEKVNIDHIDHVIPLSGFDSWDGVLNRLFCDPLKLQKLCPECHSKKTTDEQKIRKQYRKENLEKKKKESK